MKGVGVEKKKAKTLSLQQNKEEKSKENTVQEMFKKFEDRLDSIEKKMKNIELKEQEREKAESISRSQSYSHNPRRDRGGKERGRGRGTQQPSYTKPAEAAKEGKDEDVVCYSCGQVGHVTLGCRVRTGHQKD